VSNKNMTKIALAFVAAMALVAAQDAPKKVAKDQAEADLINGIAKDPNGATRLANLEKWTKGYPETAFSDERDEIYLATYQQLNKPREAFDIAQKILTKHPDNFLALSTTIAYLPYLNNGNPAAPDMDAAEKASNHVLNDADTVFADKNKPANQTPDQWSKMKPTMGALAQKTIGFIYFQKKDWPRAEAELIKALKLDPTQAQTSYMLANALFSQRQQKPEKQPPSIFEFARAAVYDGPNALPAQLRGQINTSVTKTYTAYHGSNDGLDKLMALAKANALPPDGFTIESTADIAMAKAKAEEDAMKANPMMAMWKTIKDGLTGSDPDGFFASSVKGAALPGGANGVTKFKGKLVSAKPEVRPKELVIAVQDPAGDCTLKLAEGQTPWAGKMEPGGDIEFEGVATAYSKAPYMLTLEVEKDKVTGWTGKNVAPVKKAAPAKKKAQ
jgi:tetratricopeptide (TPR) repeat protein